jgi:hypothetical protein
MLGLTYDYIFEKLTVAQLVKKSPYIIESEGSLPCLQEPATGCYPDPDKSNLYIFLLLLDHIYYYTSHLRLDISSSLSGFTNKFLCIFHLFYACYMARPSHPPSFYITCD